MHHGMAHFYARRKSVEDNSANLRLQNLQQFEVRLQVFVSTMDRCRKVSAQTTSAFQSCCFVAYGISRREGPKCSSERSGSSRNALASVANNNAAAEAFAPVDPPRATSLAFDLPSRRAAWCPYDELIPAVSNVKPCAEETLSRSVAVNESNGCPSFMNNNQASCSIARLRA